VWCIKLTKDYVNDSESEETEQLAKITAMQSLNENLQSTGEAPIKMKDWRGYVPNKKN
jgi:hypothetical protein